MRITGNIQALIETILSGAKHSDKKEIGSKVYKDEPILMTAAQMKNYTPPRYREMRKLAKGGVYYEHDEKTFYEQAKFMEDFEEDFEFHGEFVRYFPTYQSMNDQELRGYFSWRTKVRRGTVEKTSRSFAFVYIYELLNQIGVSTPMEGFHALDSFWRTYSQLDPQIDRYVRLWMKDYIIYNNLDKALLEPLVDVGADHALLVLLHYEEHSSGEVFEALNTLSSYNLENSRFYKQYPEDVKSVAVGVFSALSQYYAKNRKYNLCEKFFGRARADYYLMFQSAVYYNRSKHGDAVYEINEIHKYRCDKGRWSYERYLWKDGKNQQIGALFRSIDYRMRLKYEFKSTLKEPETTKIFAEAIEKEIEKALELKRKNERPKIEIDVSKLQAIRRTALETQSKLIVEEAAEMQRAKEARESVAWEEVSEGLTAGSSADEQLTISMLSADEAERRRTEPSKEFVQAGLSKEAFQAGLHGIEDFWGEGKERAAPAISEGTVPNQAWPNQAGPCEELAQAGPSKEAFRTWPSKEVFQAGLPESSGLSETAAEVCPLNETQYQFMQCLLYGQAYDGLLKSKGLMLSVVIDSINESLFDTFCDTVILYDGDVPGLIEDYIEELKGMIRE